MRLLPFALGLLVPLLAVPSVARACDCLRAEPAPAEAFASAERVVEAVVTAGVPAAPGGEEVTLTVQRTLKGPGSTTLTVRVPGSSCGYRLRPGERLLLYLPPGKAPPLLQQCRPGLRVVLGERIAAEVAALPTVQDGGR